MEENGMRSVLVAVASLTLGVGIVLGGPGAAGADLQPGDILVVDTDRLILVNPSTGERTIISSPSVGNGPIWSVAADVAQDANGQILVVGTHDPASAGLGGVFRVNPSTGDRIIISTSDVSTQCLSGAFSSCVAFGVPFTCCTGNQTGDCPGLFGGTECCPGPYSCCTGQNTGDGTPPCAQVGTGAPFRLPYAISASMRGDIVVVDDATFSNINTDPRVIRVDSSTGDRAVVSSSNIGSGPAFDTVGGITGLTVFQQVVAAVVPMLGPPGY